VKSTVSLVMYGGTKAHPYYEVNVVSLNHISECFTSFSQPADITNVIWTLHFLWLFCYYWNLLAQFLNNSVYLTVKEHHALYTS